MLREDTVITANPHHRADDDFDDEKTRAGRRPKFIQSRTDAAIAAIGSGAPPAPRGWQAQQPRLRVIAEPPQTMAAVPSAAARRPPPAPPAPPSRARRGSSPPPAPAGKKAIMPIPEPCFEPSVVAEMPLPPAAPPADAQPEPSAQADAAAQGKVIVMFGCRGGAGSTTLAVNTAANLARAGKRVCVVDLDLQLGDVFVALDLAPDTSIAALAREASTIDAAALVRRLARHDSGIYAISQTGHLDDVDPQLAERMPALMSTLCDHFDYVIVDGVRDFDDCALAALDMADTIALVMSQDVASVRRARRAVQIFRQLGYGDAKLRLVLNRARRGARVDDAEVARALGLAVGARVRNDYKRAVRAMDDGALLGDVARGSGIASDLAALAANLGGTRTAPAARRGFLSRFRKGGR